MTEPEGAVIQSGNKIRGLPPGDGKIAQRVAQELRSRIADGVLRVGEVLPTQQQLQAELGVGRATLREALRVLENEGLVEIRAGSHRGAVVCLPDPAMLAGSVSLILDSRGTTIADVMAARTMLEVAVVGAVATQGGYDDFAMLQELIDKGWVGAADVQATSAFIDTFSSTLCNVLANPALALVYRILLDATGHHAPPAKSEQMARADEVRLKDSYRDLIVMFRSRNATAAQQHWTTHMHMITELVTRGFQRIRPRALSI